MGPHDDVKEQSKATDPIRVDREEDQGGNDDGWHIGFEVEMRGVGIQEGVVVRNGREGEEEADNDDDTSFTGDDESSSQTSSSYPQRPGPAEESTSTSAGNGYSYQQLPSSPAAAAQEWLPSMPPVNLPPLAPIPAAEEFKIKHQPIDIAMDQEKADQIKSIMGRLNVPLATALPTPPAWLQGLDDRKLTELVHQLTVTNNKKGGETKP